jgi:hypothetical protein
MSSFSHWLQLLHVRPNQRLPLQIDGETSFGRSPKLYDYSKSGSVRAISSKAVSLKEESTQELLFQAMPTPSTP